MLSFGSTNTARVCLAIVVYCAVTKLSAAAHKYTWNVKYKTSCIQCNPFWTSNSKKLNGKHIEHRWKQNHHIDSESESWEPQRLSECVCVCVFIFVCLRCWKASNQQCVPCIQRKCSRSCYHLCIVFFYIKRKKRIFFVNRMCMAPFAPFLYIYVSAVWCGIRTVNAYIHPSENNNNHHYKLQATSSIHAVIVITQDAFHENTLVHNLQFNRQQFSFVSYGAIDRQILERISIPLIFRMNLVLFSEARYWFDKFSCKHGLIAAWRTFFLLYKSRRVHWPDWVPIHSNWI